MRLDVRRCITCCGQCSLIDVTEASRCKQYVQVPFSLTSIATTTKEVMLKILSHLNKVGVCIVYHSS